MTLKELSDLEHAESCKTSEFARRGYLPKTVYSDKTANGLEKAIVKFLTLHGAQGERVKNSGRVLPAKRIKSHSGNTITVGSDKYIPGTGRNGTADVAATIPISIQGHKVGLKVAIEIKIGADRQSEVQKEYEQEVIAAGGRYWIVKTWNDFSDKYFALMKEFS